MKNILLKFKNLIIILVALIIILSVLGLKKRSYDLQQSMLKAQQETAIQVYDVKENKIINLPSLETLTNDKTKDMVYVSLECPHCQELLSTMKETKNTIDTVIIVAPMKLDEKDTKSLKDSTSDELMNISVEKTKENIRELQKEGYQFKFVIDKNFSIAKDNDIKKVPYIFKKSDVEKENIKK